MGTRSLEYVKLIQSTPTWSRYTTAGTGGRGGTEKNGGDDEEEEEEEGADSSDAECLRGSFPARTVLLLVEPELDALLRRLDSAMLPLCERCLGTPPI